MKGGNREWAVELKGKGTPQWHGKYNGWTNTLRELSDDFAGFRN